MRLATLACALLVASGASADAAGDLARESMKNQVDLYHMLEVAGPEGFGTFCAFANGELSFDSPQDNRLVAYCRFEGSTMVVSSSWRATDSSLVAVAYMVPGSMHDPLRQEARRRFGKTRCKVPGPMYIYHKPIGNKRSWMEMIIGLVSDDGQTAMSVYTRANVRSCP